MCDLVQNIPVKCLNILKKASREFNLSVYVWLDWFLKYAWSTCPLFSLYYLAASFSRQALLSRNLRFLVNYAQTEREKEGESEACGANMLSFWPHVQNFENQSYVEIDSLALFFVELKIARRY